MATSTVRVVRTVSAVRAAVAEWRAAGETSRVRADDGQPARGHLSLAALGARGGAHASS